MSKSIKLKDDTYIDTRGIAHNKKILADIIYPVGSIYISVNSTNPSNYYGGTWEQIKDRFLLACGSTYSNGTTGGEATHKLTVNEMPSHKHILGYRIGGGGGTTWYIDGGTVDSWGTDTAVKETGGNQAHNNMPPYLAVYVWKRTK